MGKGEEKGEVSRARVYFSRSGSVNSSPDNRYQCIASSLAWSSLEILKSLEQLQVTSVFRFCAQHSRQFLIGRTGFKALGV